MSPEGRRRMQDELRQLLRVERPKVVETVAWAAGTGLGSTLGLFTEQDYRCFAASAAPE
jgi:transcription elongation GreA/GreB family factor